ncbi:MAG: hypothetical protein K2X38_13680 [Gemmataceae bacterium]|nr:hypothetical protein [Gemmataceae bacterium]
MSSYLASIMQERPIVYLIAKCLWRRGIPFDLEDEKRDLLVDGKRIEFKFNWDLCEEKLAKELAKHGGDLAAMWEQVKTGGIKGASWGVMPKIYEDWCVRKPDLFVWVICSRDVHSVPVDALERMCRGYEQFKVNSRCPYDSSGSGLISVDAFCERLRSARPFNMLRESISTRGDFPSTYHFRIFERMPGAS